MNMQMTLFGSSIKLKFVYAAVFITVVVSESAANFQIEIVPAFSCIQKHYMRTSTHTQHSISIDSHFNLSIFNF